MAMKKNEYTEMKSSRLCALVTDTFLISVIEISLRVTGYRINSFKGKICFIDSVSLLNLKIACTATTA